MWCWPETVGKSKAACDAVTATRVMVADTPETRLSGCPARIGPLRCAPRNRRRSRPFRSMPSRTCRRLETGHATKTGGHQGHPYCIVGQRIAGFSDGGPKPPSMSFAVCLGDLRQHRLAPTHGDADRTEAEQHHRPGCRFRNRAGDGLKRDLLNCSEAVIAGGGNRDGVEETARDADF